MQVNEDLRQQLFGADSDEEDEIFNEVTEPAESKRKAEVRPIHVLPPSDLLYCTHAVVMFPVPAFLTLPILQDDDLEKPKPKKRARKAEQAEAEAEEPGKKPFNLSSDPPASVRKPVKILIMQISSIFCILPLGM